VNAQRAFQQRRFLFVCEATAMQRRSEKALGYGDPIELKAVSAGNGELEGYSSKFWVVDSYGEFTIPGCFQTSIKDRGPAGADRILLRYEHEFTIGKPTELNEDAEGLHVKAKISDDGMWGTVLRRQLADGIPYGMSIGFYRFKTRPGAEDDPLIFDYAPEWVKRMYALEGPEFLIGHTELKLVEKSTVSFPAVDNAVVEGYRSEQRQRTLQSLLTDLKAGRLSDEDKEQLKDLAEAWLADGRSNGGETPLETPTTRTVTRRNHAAEVAVMVAQLRQHGVDMGALIA
jgi:HK97 family phage prohead protease